MKLESWTAPSPCGEAFEEMAVTFDGARPIRLLILPAWFDEANKLRRLTLDVMRRLDEAGIDSVLPDLPGCNESLAPLDTQTLEGWRAAAQTAAQTFGATHIFAVRAGALIAPDSLPAWHYMPQAGPKLLGAMLRAQTLSEREAGRHISRDELLADGLEQGLTLAGWQLGPDMMRAVNAAEPVMNARTNVIEQSDIGGAGLWLRAEPSHDPDQAHALARIIADALGETAEP